MQATGYRVFRIDASEHSLVLGWNVGREISVFKQVNTIITYVSYLKIHTDQY